MRGCLFTLLLGAVIVGFLVVVGLPALAGGIITGGLTAAGLVADDTEVTVSSDPPTDLLGLRADTVRVTASDASFRGMAIGSLDLALGDVAVLDRTAGTVDGELRDVTVTGPDGRAIAVDRITLVGGSEGVTTTTLVRGAEAEARIADAIEAETGIRPSSVRLDGPDRLTVRLGGASLAGRFAVTPGGDLVVRGTEGLLEDRGVVIVRGGEDLPVELTSVRVTPEGDLRLTGDLAVDLLG